MSGEHPLGARLREARQARGLSLRKLGAATGVHFTHLVHVEAGRRDLTARRIAPLARELGVSADWLLGLSESGGP